MRIGWIARRIDRARSEDGVAIILVVGVGMVVSMLLLSLTAYTILSVTHSRREQDTQAALTAAQAGVDDYLSRLNSDNTYWQHPNNCTLNPAIRTIGDSCGDTKTGWVPIAGASTSGATGAPSCATTDAGGNYAASCSVYHYDADSTQTIATGQIKLTSTGKAHGTTRSVRVFVRRQSFGDFMYYTDIETVDPANGFVYDASEAPTAVINCARHWYDTPARTPQSVDPPGCPEIQFGGGDTVNGPVHSNDTLYVGNATFNGTVTTSFPPCQPNSATGAPAPIASCYRSAGGTHTFAKGISYVPPLAMPPTNLDLHHQTEAAYAIGAVGCLYTGPTRIHFNSGGSMTVWSPYTKTVSNPACGTAPFTAAPQTVTPPPNNVVYVDPVPAAQALPAVGPCASGSIGGFPQANDLNLDASFGNDYDCRSGLVYVDGTFNGRMTLAANLNIVIVGDIKYDTSSAGNDSLGLVANGTVFLYHPICKTSTPASGSTLACTANQNLPRSVAIPSLMPSSDGSPYFYGPTINAAMLSLNHSFVVQAYTMGATLGTLNVYGSIAQKYRGPVGQIGSTGYVKNYVYDNRLKFAPPPFYLNPVQSKYISAVFSETAPAYTATSL